ncbi:MAG: molybdenum cofactor biosynthesis protein MoeB [Chloroflexi bacterium HGW-Chloroflexi-4]|jgi:adenylyltransferase/sulfurtransferase|nr:MAG: molybdenum cofactor biosynthesis protein MoeB [Chloroflexi bacterium HGW-Chloroflexi-4]
MTQTIFTQDELYRYSRHLMVPEIGLHGQARLKAASVLIVGAGGLGSPAALYLSAAGVGRIGIVDDDVVDTSNLQRQVLHGSSQISRPKVESARERMLDLNPFIKVEAILESFDQKNAERIADGFDLLLDCSDNFATRYLINDLCALTHRPVVYGAIYRFEGQVSVFDATKGACYRCLFPEPPPDGAAPACGEAGVFSITPGIIGTLQAVEALKLILGTGEPLINKLLMVDTLAMSFRTINLKKNPACPLCSEKPQITALIDYPTFCAVSLAEPLEANEMIPAHDLALEILSSSPPQVLDVRSEVELQISTLPNVVHIPAEQLMDRIGELDRDRALVVFCRNGTRSRRALHQLKEAGFNQVKNLTGGINAWAREVDTTLFEY